MNSIILMAEVLTEPELRYTPDNQNAIASFLVQFPSTRPEEQPNRIKVIGWNNLANEIMERKYHRGTAVLIEGRLKCDTIDKDGRKEKRTEITASRIHDLSGSGSSAAVVSKSKPMAPEPVQDDVPF